MIIYICPACNRWQKWRGNCDSFCEVKTLPWHIVEVARPKEALQ